MQVNLRALAIHMSQRLHAERGMRDLFIFEAREAINTSGTVVHIGTTGCVRPCQIEHDTVYDRWKRERYSRGKFRRNEEVSSKRRHNDLYLFVVQNPSHVIQWIASLRSQ